MLEERVDLAATVMPLRKPPKTEITVSPIGTASVDEIHGRLTTHGLNPAIPIMERNRNPEGGLVRRYKGLVL